MIIDKQGICDRLYEARKNKKISQAEAGAKLNIQQSAYSDLETGKRDITIYEASVLAEVFDVPFEWLIGMSDANLSVREIRLLELFKQFIIYIRNK